MSRQSVLTAAIATVLGATLGGLLFWRTLKFQKKKRSQALAYSDPGQEEQLSTVQHPVSLPLPSPSPPPISRPVATLLPSPEQLLRVQPVVVTSGEDWEQLWPSLERELSVFPVLGLDCEWVKGQCVRVFLH